MFRSDQIRSVTQSCPTLCDPMNRSTPGLPVHHQLPKSTQTHVHRVGDAITISSSEIPFSSCPESFPASGSFPTSQFFSSGDQSIGVSASASVFPMIIQRSPRDSQESPPALQFKSINSSALSFLHGPTLTSVHDYWKSHSFDYMDICCQNNVSAF